MKSRFFAAFLLALPLAAQDDTVTLTNGTKLEGVKVTSFDIRELKYTKGGAQSVPTDQVVKVDLAKFNDYFRLGLKDADLMLTKAREAHKEKNILLAQLGFVSAASQFFDAGKAGEAVGVLDELQKEKDFAEAGVLPDVYRMKFEYYMGQGGKGAASAASVAKKYQTDASGGGWPAGLAVEAEFFQAMAENAANNQPKDFQLKLRAVVAKGQSGNPMVANRANVQLAHSLRENKDPEGSRKIYDDLAKRDGVDSSSRAGAFLGLGHLALEEGSGANKELFRKALLLFLRVRLETRDAWPSQHAEAMYYAIQAADKWRGNDFAYIIARCRGVLYNDFGDTEWASKAKNGR